MKAMAKHRTHSVEFKRQVSQEYLSGGTLHGLAKRHNVSRNLIRIWVEKYQAGALDEDVASAGLLETYEARIAALERLVGKQALELEFLKGALQPRPRPRSETISAITISSASPSPTPMYRNGQRRWTTTSSLGTDPCGRLKAC
jgi:transposase-like protein